MDPKHLFLDSRFTGTCVYCGGNPDTRDHVPSKVLLDEPYPPDLPVVGACKKCNESFSLDEQYLACFIECVMCGDTDTVSLQRPNIKRILDENPTLQHKIKNSRREVDYGGIRWEPESERFRNVILKLAHGHVAFELYPKITEPTEVSFAPLSELTEQQSEFFIDIPVRDIDLLPEIGTRAFKRAFLAYETNQTPFLFCEDWIVVQPGRYRYKVAETDRMIVRMVLSEYLACEVVW